jgi:hypothetical protein
MIYFDSTVFYVSTFKKINLSDIVKKKSPNPFSIFLEKVILIIDDYSFFIFWIRRCNEESSSLIEIEKIRFIRMKYYEKKKEKRKKEFLELIVRGKSF